MMVASRIVIDTLPASSALDSRFRETLGLKYLVSTEGWGTDPYAAALAKLRRSSAECRLLRASGHPSAQAGSTGNHHRAEGNVAARSRFRPVDGISLRHPGDRERTRCGTRGLRRLRAWPLSGSWPLRGALRPRYTDRRDWRDDAALRRTARSPHRAGIDRPRLRGLAPRASR